MKESMGKTKSRKWLSRCLCLLLCAVMGVLSGNVEALADETTEFHEGMVAFLGWGEEELGSGYTPYGYGFVDKKGNVVVGAKYYHVRSFSEGMAAIEKTVEGYKWGFIDKNGKEVIEPKYYNVVSYSEGIWCAKIHYTSGHTEYALMKAGKQKFIHWKMRKKSDMNVMRCIG